MKNNELKLSRMTVDDLGDVHSIERHSYPNPWSYQTFLAELDNNDCANYFVVRCLDKIIGYIGMWIILDEGHITNIAVHHEWRGQGVGEFLMRSMEEHALKRGIVKMTLEVRVSNERAKSLYHKIGYLGHGIRPRYYLNNNEDALIMWKDLKNDERERETNAGNRD